MDLLAGIADTFRKKRFDMRVNIFLIRIDGKITGLDFVIDCS
jgi:hypothetical protein